MDDADLARLRILLPDVELVLTPTARGLRASARRAMSGIAIRDVRADGIRFGVPIGRNLAHGHVAAAIATTLAVRRRFRTYLPTLQTVTFDRSSTELASGVHSGEALAVAGRIHLGAGLVVDPSRPVEFVAEVMAHELWHLIDARFQHDRPRDGIAMRRVLGEHLGVATLEHAILGSEAGASRERRTANVRLVDEVSAYAATRTNECAAEMFRSWWSRGDTNPTLALFGRLVDEYFPPDD
jgi:hypothetical protein